MSSELLLLLSATEDISELYQLAVKEINDGTLTILNLVNSLSTQLTGDDEEIRRQGVLLLANVLKNLSKNYLGKDEINVLIQFFCDRLNDRLIIIPGALKGLEALTEMENFPDVAPTKILHAMSMNITVQTLSQSSRLTYYAILKNLMLNQTDVLLQNSTDFVYNVITAIDSESDPRCLIYLFQFLPKLFNEFPIKHLTEEAFSVLECYFPIDFNPRDKVDITREDLAQGLQACLLATPLFAPFIIPTLLEKLDSQLKVAHLDSLKILMNGINFWPLNDIKSHLSDIWKSLSKLLLPPNDNEVADFALKTVAILIDTLNKSNSSYNELDQLFDDISASTHGFLSDSNLSLFLPTMKLLSISAQTCQRSCEYVIKMIIGQFLILLEQNSGRDVTLSALGPILNASVKFNCWNNDSNTIGRLLIPLPDKIIDLLSDNKTRSQCFSCLNEITSYLTAVQREKIFDKIHDALHHELTFDSETCSNYIKLIGTKYPEEVKNNLLMKLNIIGNNLETKQNLDILCCCCNILQLTSFTADIILQHATTTSTSSIAINCLSEFCQKTDKKVLTIFGTESKVPEKLITYALEVRENNDPINLETILNISKIVQSIVRPLIASHQKIVLNNCLIQFSLLDANNFSSLNCNQLFLLEGLLCPLRPEVSLEMYNNLITSLINSSIKCDLYNGREIAAIILATILNKCQQDILDESINTITNILENDENQAKILLLSWTTKSLIMRGDNRANCFIDKLIGSLYCGTNKMEAADGFKLILLDTNSLSLQNYCTIKLLYKQRIFNKLDDLITLLQNKDLENHAILLAIANLLIYVPQSLVISKLDQLIPVMVECIDSSTPKVIAAILEVIANLLEKNEEIFEKHFDTFIPRCLNCLTIDNMHVKLQALNCIYYYGRYNEINVLPYRDKVLNELEKSLDDKKRLVRRKAVRARNRWFLVGGLPDR